MSKEKTVSEILKFTPEQRAAYLNTIAGEAYLGGQGRDIAGVASNLIARQLSPNFPNEMMGVVTAPGQYEANFKYSPEQLSAENLRGLSERDQQRLIEIAENPNLVGGAFQKTGGATSFRGQALLDNKLPQDVMFEDKGNFYFDPVSKEVQEKAVALLGGDPEAIASYQPQGVGQGDTSPTVNLPNNSVFIENINVQPYKEEKKKTGFNFQNFMKRQILNSVLNPMAGMNFLGGYTSVNPSLAGMKDGTIDNLFGF